MISTGDREQFETTTRTGLTRGEVAALAAQVRAAGAEASEAGKALAAALAHGAFVAPERTAGLYDHAAEGWFGGPVGGRALEPVTIDAAPEPPGAEFWTAFWELVEDMGSGLDAGTVTMRTAGLGPLLSANCGERLSLACLAFPGVREAAAHGPPGRFRLDDLAACPAGSLGHDFYSLIIDNGFDLEVLDREALGLSSLPSPHNYLNARILQVHDLWHLVGGYRTTGLHEVAISGFQLGQFGHGYSAVFLAMALASTTLKAAPYSALLFEIILGAWVHGRQTPCLLDAPWEEIWMEPIDQVRRHLGVEPYASPVPADLFEQALAA